jgi:hypothetical protein
MTTIKIYSKNKPLKINGHLEIYNISNGVTSDSVWYSESTDDYDTSRRDLEKEGYTAHPASYKEIQNKIYTIFREAI